MLYELRRFNILLPCAFFDYRGEIKFQILFKILAFLVHGRNRHESIIMLLRVEYVST